MENQKPIKFEELPCKTQELTIKLLRDHKLITTHHNQKYGDASFIHSVVFNGKRLVLVRNGLVCSDNPAIEWNSPADFLLSHLKTTLGNDWVEHIINEEIMDCHPIAQWFKKGNPNLSNSRNDTWIKPNGKALALLHLAYDIYTLDNISKLQDSIIKRLKIKEEFNGARYELFVFSTLIRSGFELEYIDQHSGLNGRVPECKAILKSSGDSFFVEAKTRNIKKILGSSQGKSKSIHLYQNLKDAVNKNVNGPYIIFHDLNMPEFKVKKGNIHFEKVRGEYKKLEAAFDKKMPNIVCFTNIPFHYGRDDITPTNENYGLMVAKYPMFSFQNEFEIMELLQSGLDKYKYLPTDFNEYEKIKTT